MNHFVIRLRHGRSCIIALTLLIGASVLASVYPLASAPAKVQPEPAAPGKSAAEVMGTGTLEAHIKAAISSKISGRITDVRVDQGDQVSPGQLLVRLDDEDLKRQVEVEQANVAAREAAVERLQAEKNRVRATVELARRDYHRAGQLVQGNAIARADFDKFVEVLGVAEAEVARAEAALIEARRQLVAAEKALEFHRARLADTVITAPFAGLVVRRDRHPGDVVVPGCVVLCLVATAELWVSAWVDESEMARLQPGQPARVVFRSEPDRSYPGKVVRLGRETDRETREFLVDVQPEVLPKNWAIGQRAEVYIDVSAGEVVPHPTDARNAGPMDGQKYVQP